MALVTFFSICICNARQCSEIFYHPAYFEHLGPSYHAETIVLSESEGLGSQGLRHVFRQTLRLGARRVVVEFSYGDIFIRLRHLTHGSRPVADVPENDNLRVLIEEILFRLSGSHEERLGLPPDLLEKFDASVNNTTWHAAVNRIYDEETGETLALSKVTTQVMGPAGEPLEGFQLPMTFTQTQRIIFQQRLRLVTFG